MILRRAFLHPQPQGSPVQQGYEDPQGMNGGKCAPSMAPRHKVDHHRMRAKVGTSMVSLSLCRSQDSSVKLSQKIRTWGCISNLGEIHTYTVSHTRHLFYLA